MMSSPPATGLGSWRITADGDAAEATLFHRHFGERLATRLADAASALDGGRSHQGPSLLSDGSAARWTHPGGAWIALSALVSSDVAAHRVWLSAGLEYLRASLGDAPPVRFGGEGPSACWAAPALARIEAETARATGAFQPMHLSSGLRGEAEMRARRALDAVDWIWPEASRQIERLVRDVVWFEAPRFWSSTAAYAFGAIYMNARPAWTVPHFVDTFLHETGHLSLTVKQTMVVHLENPEATAASPLRDDPRPLSGILHAAFALSRITEGLARYVGSSAPLEDKPAAASLLADYLARLDAALHTLESAGELTASGHALLLDMRRGASERNGTWS